MLTLQRGAVEIFCEVFNILYVKNEIMSFVDLVFCKNGVDNRCRIHSCPHNQISTRFDWGLGRRRLPSMDAENALAHETKNV